MWWGLVEGSQRRNVEKDLFCLKLCCLPFSWLLLFYFYFYIPYLCISSELHFGSGWKVDNKVSESKHFEGRDNFLNELAFRVVLSSQKSWA